MKILRVRFFNLNSLRGEPHIVDFSQAPLSEAGLFAITGATGAGKTTILDAITLALYGQVPRYETSGPEQIMSHGTGESWAEVEFEVSGRQYRAKWSQYRARKHPSGKLQDPRMELSERLVADDGTETWPFLETYKSKVPLRVAELSGLEYRQFLRSVLLAQGDFTKFLKATAGERAQLLEKITDTRKYSDISRAAFEKAKQEAQQVETLRLGLAGVVLLSPEEAADLASEIQKLRQQLEEATAAGQQLQQAQMWLSRLQELRIRHQESHARQLELTAQADTLTPLRQRLALHSQAAPFATDWALLRQSDEHVACLHQEANQLRQQLPHLQQLRNTAATARTAAQTAYEAATAARQEQEPKLREAEQLDESIQQQSRQLQEKRLAYDERNTQCKHLREQLKQVEAQTREAQQQLTAAAEWLTRHGRRAEMVEVFAAFTGLVQDWDRLRTEAGQFDGKVSQLTKRLASLQEEEQGSTAAAEAARQQLTAHQQALGQAATTRDELLRQLHHHVVSLRGELVEKEARREEMRQLVQAHQLILSHEQARQQLHPHKPCPLCGALEHPYAAGVLGLTDASLAQEQQKVEALTQEAHALNTRVNHLNTFLNLLEHAGGDLTRTLADAPLRLVTPAAEEAAPTEARAVVRQLQELQQQQIQAEKTQAQATTELQAAVRAQVSVRQDLLEAKLGFDEVQEQLPTVRKQLESLLSNFNLAFTGENGAAMQAQLRDLEAEYQTRRQAQAKAAQQVEVGSVLIDKLTQDAHKDTAWLQEHRQGIVAQHEAIELQRKQRLQLFASPNVAQARQQLEETVQQAEDQRQQAEQALRQHETALALAAAQLTQREQEATRQQRRRQEQHEALTAALTAAGLAPTPAALTALLLPEAEVRRLAERLQRHEQALALTQQALTDLVQQLHQEQARALTTEPVESIEQQLATSNQQLATLNQQLGQRQQRLHDHRNGQERHATLAKQLADQQQQARRWRQLAEVIGSADGKKFSEFAQGLTLARLTELANRHLHRLSDRYRILRNPQEHLDLLIIDEYQGGSSRSMNSLSGGECFLVSLALALGLSELASHRTQIDTLFIDEGFGTLDPDTLDIALTALETLQGTGKTIGVISHVEALKERVGTQINVRKGVGGVSSLRVLLFGEEV